MDVLHRRKGTTLVINPITVKFYRYDDVGNPVVVHTEQCHNIFEADQLIADESQHYDAVEIIDHTTPGK